MDTQQLEYFKTRLLEMQARFQGEIGRLEQATDVINEDASYGVSNHMADDATDMYEREKNLALIEDRQQLLDQIAAAMDRISDGTYGICMRTGKPIPLERLEVLPYATVSVEAQER